MVDSPTRQRRPAAHTMPAVRRFDFDEYYRMVDAGILGKEDQVELIEGVILEKSPIGSRHYACVNDLTRILISMLSVRAIVGVQGPLRLSAMSAPEPDLVLLRPRDDHYRTTLPGPDDVLLLIEVSDSSLRFDRLIKLPLDAAAGISEVWIVDLAGTRVLVHRQPQAGGYGQTSIVRRSGSVAPAAFPDAQIPLSSTFG